MTSRGYIQSVNTVLAGDQLAFDAVTGATSFAVVSAAPFNPTGGTVELVDIYLGDEISQTVDYTTASTESGALSLVAPLAHDFSAGTTVNVVPDAPYTTAYVLTDEKSQPLPAMVPQNMRTAYSVALADGIRDPGTGAGVICQEIGGRWTVVQVLGAKSTVDGATIDPDTTIPPAALTDGLAPASSPQPVLEAFATGGLHWSLTPVANPDPTKFRIYADTVDPPAQDVAHLVADTAARSGSFAAINGVALLPTDASAPIPSYYIAAVEYDADGEAALSTTSLPASPRRASGPDISADYVYAGEIEANQIRAGQFEADIALVASLFVGGYIDLDGDASTITIYADIAHTIPLVQLSPTGSVWRGQIITDDIAVLNSILLQGIMSRISNNALLTIANGVADPTTKPSITEGWQQVAQPAIPSGYTLNGLCDHPTAGYATRLLFKTADKRAYTQVINMATGAQVSLTILADVPGFTEDMFSGIAYLGGYYYVGVMNYSDPDSSTDAVYLTKFNATTNAYVAKVVATYYGAGNDRSASFACIGVDYVNSRILLAVTGDLTQIVSYTTSLVYDHDDLLDYSTPTFDVLRFAGYGPFDYGANRWIASIGTRATIASSTASNTLSDTGDAAWSGVSGARYFWHATDARFYMLSAGILYRLAPYGADETFWAEYADTDATHTTAPSPKESLLIHARKFATVQLPPGAPSTTGADVFVGYGGSAPSTANMHKRAETLSSRVMLLTGGKVVTGANPPTASTFSAGTPGEIATEAGGWLLTGAGRGSADLIDHKPVYVGSKTANQAVATSTDVKLTWVDNATHSGPDTAFITQASGDITLLKAGWYEVYACAQWAIQGTNTRQLNFYLNGAVIAEGRQPGSTSGAISQQLKRIIKVAANDVLSIHAFQDSGSSINVVGNANLPSVVSVKWMGPT